MTRRIIGPFNRVEGDLEVSLDTENGVVREAKVAAPMFRGFERMLVGRSPLDALVIVPRICGICSISQSVAAAKAIGDMLGVTPPEMGRKASQIVHGVENLADHLTHFYLFFMPDFTKAVYAGHDWHPAVVEKFAAGQGAASRRAVEARTKLMHAIGILAGKWPHTLAIQPGGLVKAPSMGEKVRLLQSLQGFRDFLEAQLFGDSLEAVAALESQAALEAWAESHAEADFGLFLHLARSLDLITLGRGYDGFLSYGAYGWQDEPLWPQGVWDKGAGQALDLSLILEDVSHARMDGPPLQPHQGVTRPNTEKGEGAYTWCKAPRLGDRPMEVGALARQQVAGHPLIRNLVAAQGGNVLARVVARLLELALLLPRLEDWARELKVSGDYYQADFTLTDGSGVGLVEAARGSLGHWLTVERGVISKYQIIAPTTWNFSPRDGQGQPGPLEHALEGTMLRPDDSDQVAAHHIVRSFDPCMACTVH